MDALKALYPDSLELLGLSDETREIVSEPPRGPSRRVERGARVARRDRAAEGRRAQAVPPAAL